MNAFIQENHIEEAIPRESNETKSSYDFKVINTHLKFPKVSLQLPNKSGYLLMALEVDERAPLFITESKKKKDLLRRSKEFLKTIQEIDYVADVAMFKARFIPPGKGSFIKKRRDKAHMAKYDVVILIETNSYLDAEQLKQEMAFIQLREFVISNAIHAHITTAKNIRKMGDVDHHKQGVFLFNYFYADDVNQNLKVWEYTAGWFENQTGLDNSTLFRTQEEGNRLYSVINHCRWDKLSDILPSLIFKSTFKTYVLANFEANNTAPIPILYKLA